MPETWTTLRVLDWTAKRFEQAGLPSARLEAQVLLAHVLSCDRMALYTDFDRPLAPPELGAYRELIKRRLAGEPTAYLVGEQEFWSLPFAVDERVLIPRRDTETLIEVALDESPDRGVALEVADIGTGCGAIAVTLASELKSIRVVATDVSEAALEVASANALRNGVAERIEFRLGDLCSALPRDHVFDVVAANLPYVPRDEIDTLSAEVRHEPRAALDGGADGLDIVRRLAAQIAPFLSPGGLLLLEHGFDQGPSVAGILAGAGGFEDAKSRRDLAGVTRVTYARRRA